MTRNEKILVAVLRGYTLAQVGSIYGLTRERIKQIAVKTVKKYDKSLYGEVMCNYVTGSIKEFRKHKNRLIGIISAKNESHQSMKSDKQDCPVFDDCELKKYAGCSDCTWYKGNKK